MSRNNNNNKNIQPAAKKPYCKVCFDAGKPESEYTGHWVRTLPDHKGNTKVCCPTLLGQNCGFCHEIGHTVKFCKVLEKHNKNLERAEKKEKNDKKAKKEEKKIVKKLNAFASLCEDSDSEDEEEVEYPELKAKEIKEEVKEEVKTALTGWAAIVAKPAEVKKAAEPTKRVGLVLVSDFIKPVVAAAPWATKKPAKSCWADESDTEDETEDEMPYTEEVDATW